jgi:hypothetical protein
MVFGFDDLSLDGERLLFRFVCFGSEVYNSCFLGFKSRSTPSFQGNTVHCKISFRPELIRILFKYPYETALKQASL